MAPLAEPSRPPPTPRGEEVDDFHGTPVADPYRWLEDAESPEVAQWVAAQNAFTEGWLAASPWRPALAVRLAQLQQIERRTPVACVLGVLYLWHRTGSRAQPLLVAEPLEGGEARAVLDPLHLAADGTVAVVDVSVSPDGRWLAYAVADGGSDWRLWRVRDLLTLQDLPDRIEHARFSGAAWLRDSSGFVYGRYPAQVRGRHAALADHELCLHRLGQPQAADTLLFRRPDHPRWVFSPHVSRCGRWLFVGIWDGSPNHRLGRVDLRQPGSAATPVLDLEVGNGSWVGSTDAGEPILLTDALGGTGAVVAIDPEHPQRERWRTLVSPGPARLESAARVGGHIVTCSLHDGASRLQRVPLGGGPATPLPLPGLGTADGFVVDDAAAGGGCAEPAALHFCFQSFTTAPALMCWREGAEAPGVRFEPRVPFDAARYETVLEWADSADGTRVPMHVTRRRGTALDGRAPCLLIGYGGFGLAQRPTFVASRVAWLEMGGVLAQAMLRGGGEYGRAWHDAARLADKPRTFEDFIASAEALARSGHAAPGRLVAHGGSNGGLTSAAAVLARPELFGALVAAVPVLDMLRYHRFGIGAAWAADYGRADDPQQFHSLLQYSPLHNVRPGRAYPPALLLTAERDDRVHPAHAFKFAATMQHAAASAASAAPVLLRVEPRAGHGAGKSAQADVREKADLYTFLAIVLELPFDARVFP